MSTLQFLGAARTVTGSKYLLEHAGFRMLVDCGLFQGLKELRLRNWNPWPVEPASLDLVVLTHAHLDHSGYLPVIVRDGYAKQVLTTSATADLCGILLPDSGHLQEEDARFAMRHGYSKHNPPRPLYTEEEARKALAPLRPVQFDETVEVHPQVSLTFRPDGHILGAAQIEVRLREPGQKADKVILFSGDLGRPRQPLLPSPVPLIDCDHLLVESTYGDRDHSDEDPRERLAQVIQRTATEGGVVVIPAFAVGRTQHVLFLLRELQQAKRLPAGMPIHVDSPMAIHTIRILLKHPEAQGQAKGADAASSSDPLGLQNVHLDVTVQESKALNGLRSPAVIISAAGMATGGRVLHHLAHRLPDPRNTVLLVGYQAAGTRGRSLQDGAREVKIHGQMVPVRARIETIDSLSAHADRGEILQWLATAPRPPRAVHLVHGDPPAMEALAAQISERFPSKVHMPQYLEKVPL